MTDSCSATGQGNASLHCRFGWMVTEKVRVTVDAVSTFAVTWQNGTVLAGRQCKNTVFVGKLLGSVSAVYGCG